MEKRILGNGFEVSAVGLGCMGFSHAYGAPSDEKDAIRTIQSAADFGYTFFDTAECYVGTNPDGSTNWNEELVGKALKDQRHSVQIATKFGVHHAHDNSLIVDSRPETIRAAVEGSLKRLGTDYIDLYYQHRIDPNVPAEEVAGVVGELMKEGKVLHFGISETDETYLRAANAVTKVTCIQNRYSMMARWHEALFPVLEELNIGLVAFSPLANGFLTDAIKHEEKFAEDDYRGFMPQYKEESFEKNKELLEMIRGLAKEKDATPAQISLAWMLNKKPYIVPIPGSRKTSRIEENGRAADVKLAVEEVKRMDEILSQIPMSDVFGGSNIKK